MPLILATTYTAALVAIALEMYRHWRRQKKRKEFRDYIRRTYGRNDDDGLGNPGDR